MKPLSLKQVIHGFNRHEADAVRWVYDTYYPGIASYVESISGITPDTADLESADLTKLTTWYLITYRRVFRDKVVVASELSLPCNVDDAGRVDKYTRRIPLPEREFAAVIPYIPGQDDGPGEYDVNVDEI